MLINVTMVIATGGNMFLLRKRDGERESSIHRAY